MSEWNCPHCGAPFPEKALACKECGSDVDTGWNDGPDESLLDEEFDYDETLEKEFGISKKLPFPGWIAITGFVLILLIIFAWIL